MELAVHQGWDPLGSSGKAAATPQPQSWGSVPDPVCLHLMPLHIPGARRACDLRPQPCPARPHRQPLPGPCRAGSPPPLSRQSLQAGQVGKSVWCPHSSVLGRPGWYWSLPDSGSCRTHLPASSFCWGPSNRAAACACTAVGPAAAALRHHANGTRANVPLSRLSGPGYPWLPTHTTSERPLDPPFLQVRSSVFGVAQLARRWARAQAEAPELPLPQLCKEPTRSHCPLFAGLGERL